jgi:antitoxin (DNA-binding transcriptional repressor) of toxin-antitoxin stability system
MKIRIVSEAQARRSWHRLIELQQRGFIYVIKRRGKAVARLVAVRRRITVN